MSKYFTPVILTLGLLSLFAYLVSENNYSQVRRAIYADAGFGQYLMREHYKEPPIPKDDPVVVTETGTPTKPVIVNNYYGGNKEIAAFMNKLMREQEKNLNNDAQFLMDTGQCGALNNDIGTQSLAEYRNNRFAQDLKMGCSSEKDYASKCLFSPNQSQTALIGTLLDDAKDTTFGSIIATDQGKGEATYFDNYYKMLDAPKSVNSGDSLPQENKK
jgi:hypothetical protein